MSLPWPAGDFGVAKSQTAQGKLIKNKHGTRLYLRNANKNRPQAAEKKKTGKTKGDVEEKPISRQIRKMKAGLAKFQTKAHETFCGHKSEAIRK